MVVIPSPHLELQISGDEEASPEHVHPVTYPDQSARQPNVLSVSPSSHTSEPTLKPSPQMEFHVDVDPIVPVQEYPVSIVQVLLHPSPFATLLSSHVSIDNLIPSPQIGEQVSAVVVVPPDHDQPVTGAVQSLFHPDVLSVSPSSHTSDPCSNPSPQIGVHADVAPTAPVHEYPVSIVHVLLHPSPLTTLLLSHASTDNLMPSPQMGDHVSAVVVVPPEHDHPVTGPVQSDLQPEVLSVSPSSHTSDPYNNPSPHLTLHTDNCILTAVHSQPVSTVQALVHPSPLAWLESSHSSFNPELRCPLPQ